MATREGYVDPQTHPSTLQINVDMSDVIHVLEYLKLAIMTRSCSGHSLELSWQMKNTTWKRYQDQTLVWDYIAHTALPYCSETNTQYLKDNTICF